MFSPALLRLVEIAAAVSLSSGSPASFAEVLDAVPCTVGADRQPEPEQDLPSEPDRLVTAAPVAVVVELERTCGPRDSVPLAHLPRGPPTR